MSEQDLDLEMSSKELFNSAFEEDAPDNTEVEQEQEVVDSQLEDEGGDQGLALDHQPTNEDSDDYWREFAISKGWKPAEEVDEANFKGFKAFVRDYDRIQENVESKNDIKELRKQMSEVVKTNAEVAREIEQRHQREVENLKKSLESKKEAARKELDFDTYEAVTKEIDDLEKSAAPKQEEQPAAKEAPVIVDFRTANPEVMPESDKFDPELNAAVERRFNFSLQTGVITDPSQAPALLQTLFEEEKGKLDRYKPAPTRQPPSTNSVKAKGKAVTLDPGKLSGAERSYYDHYIKKGWKDVAEEFLKESLGA